MKSSIIAALLALLSCAAGAQNQSFITSVDKNQVAMGDQFEVSFTLTGSAGGENFRAPSFADFIVLAGPNESTSMNIINGAVSSSLSYSYTLQPRSAGKFTIGPASILSGGKQLQTQPVTIVVTKGAPAPKQQQGQASAGDLGKQIGDNLFLRVSVDKSRVYQGEQITATYKIYTRLNVANYSMSKVPALTGFWTEDVDVPKQIQLTTEVVNGRQYRVGVLKKVALFPQRSGTLTVDPMEVDCVVQVQARRRSNDFFDQFFNDPFFGNVTNVNHRVQSEPVKITVLPVPTAGVPKGFAGAVGQYTMEAWLDKHQAKTNDPVTLRVKISGRGNLKLLEAPAVNVPPDLERYDPKIADVTANQGDKIAGSRTFEYLLIPRHAGNFTIPPIEFSYFDTEKKKYVSLSSQEFALSVEKGNDLVAGSAAGISKEDVQLLGEDIRFIKSGNLPLHRKGESLVGSPAFYTLSLSPIIAFFGFMIYVKRREKVQGNVVLLRNRKARKMAQRRMVAAKKFLEEKKKEEFYAEVSRALWGYIGDKLGLPPADLSLDMVRNSLDSRHVSGEAIAKLAQTIEQCEFARFAPAADSTRMDTVYHESLDLISSIEDQLG